MKSEKQKLICKNYRQVLIVVYFLISLPAGAFYMPEASRKPANFVPDDDLIVVPLVIEKNIYERFNDKHLDSFEGAKKKLEYWIRQENYAKAYGLEDAGFIPVPTNEEKENFLQKHYLRFISRDVERSTNKNIQNTIDSWSADDEIDAIDAVKQHEKVIVFAKSNKGANGLKQSKSVDVGIDKLKFGTQLRPEIGMMKFTLESNYFYARAWIGVNGNQEINIERKFTSTNTKAFVNYYIDETKTLCALDQHLIGPLSFRFSHSKDFDNFEQINKSGIEDNVTQLRFSMGF